jgi:hypothetical protein
MVDYIYSCQYNNPNSIYSNYIYHKNERGKPCEMDLPLSKNDITRILRPRKPVIESTGLGFKISKQNLKDLMASIFQGRRQNSQNVAG